MTIRKSGFVPKTFRDAGTGQEFEGGKDHLFEVGAHANYSAAGLIVERPATAPKAKAASPKAPPKAARKVPSKTTPDIEAPPAP